MDFIYGESGNAIGSLQREGNTTSVYGARGEFVGWTDAENVYLHDGRLLARDVNAFCLLFHPQADTE